MASSVRFDTTRATHEKRPLEDSDEDRNVRQRVEDVCQSTFCKYCQNYLCIRFLPVFKRFEHIHSRNNLPFFDHADLSEKQYVDLYNHLKAEEFGRALFNNEEAQYVPLICYDWGYRCSNPYTTYQQCQEEMVRIRERSYDSYNFI